MASGNGQSAVTLSPEERALLNRCKREAYLYRAGPLGLVGLAGYLYSLKYGRLASASRPTRIFFGTVLVPAVALYASVSGTLSFMKRLKTLDHSPLLETIKSEQERHSQRPTQSESSSAPAREKESSLFPKESSETYDSQSRNFFGSDDLSRQSRPSYSLFDDHSRNSIDFQRDFSSNVLGRPDWNQNERPDSKSEKPHKFMSYADRREYYHKNPKAESRFNPFEKENNSLIKDKDATGRDSV